MRVDRLINLLLTQTGSLLATPAQFQAHSRQPQCTKRECHRFGAMRHYATPLATAIVNVLLHDKRVIVRITFVARITTS